MSEQLDRIEKNVDSIIQVLGGNEKLGQKGLVEDHREIKTIVYKNKEAIGRFKLFVSGVSTVIGGAWAALVTWYNS